jgi:sugar fermentation stimulation protein A
MKFKNKLIPSKFQKRYKRFFTDVESKGKTLISHCANSGSMLGLLDKDNKAWISPADNPDRKLKYTLEIINDKKSNVGVNTHLANRIVEEAIVQRTIKEIKSYSEYQCEVKFGLHSRFDFELKNKTKKAFLEVKNVTLSRQSGIAEFPDAVTSRGLKHLEELEKAIKKGYESFLIYLVQREDCNEFRIAKDIDPKYYEGFLKAKKNGVKFISYSCKVNEKEIYVNQPIKIIFK